MIEYYEMTNRDIDELSKMYVECFNAEPWNDKWTEETAAKRLLKMLSYDGAYGIICRENGNILGMILGHDEYYYDGVNFEIKEFCIRAGIQGKGTGAKLLKYFEDKLKDKGINKIFLLTCLSDKTVGFYKKNGYNTCHNMIMMNKKI